MVETVGPVDVMRMPGRGRGAPVERLPDLADHHEVVDLASAQGPKNSFPFRGAVAAAGADRHQGFAAAVLAGAFFRPAVWAATSLTGCLARDLLPSARRALVDFSNP